jgi:O-antigen ligase
MGLFLAFGIMGAMKLGRLRRPSWLLAHSSIAFAAAGAVGFLGIVASQPTSMPFRAADLFAVAAGDEKLSDIGTFRFRAAIWEAAIDELGESRAASIAFGHGSSSAAGLRARNPSWLAFGVLDGNRVMHNEYLRTVYEWGIFGSLLLGIFLISLIGGALKLGRHGTAVVALSPMLLVSLGVENVFAGSGGPGGSGFALVAALCASRALKARLATRKAAVSAAQRQMLERAVRCTAGRTQPNWLARAEVPANA